MNPTPKPAMSPRRSQRSRKVLALAAAGCASSLPEESPPLTDMEEPLELFDEPDDEAGRGWESVIDRELALQNANNNLAEKQALFDEGLAVQSEVQAAEKTVADAEADIADARIQLGKMNVYAPLDGYLTALVDTTENTLVEANTVIGQVVERLGTHRCCQRTA